MSDTNQNNDDNKETGSYSKMFGENFKIDKEKLAQKSHRELNLLRLKIKELENVLAIEKKKIENPEKALEEANKNVELAKQLYGKLSTNDSKRTIELKKKLSPKLGRRVLTFSGRETEETFEKEISEKEQEEFNIKHPPVGIEKILDARIKQDESILNLLKLEKDIQSIRDIERQITELKEIIFQRKQIESLVNSAVSTIGSKSDNGNTFK